MIDLHTHTTFSDGELIPAEVARRALAAGYEAIAFTDHVDASNLELVLNNQGLVSGGYTPYTGLDIFLGVEITHVPPALIAQTINRARRLDAQLVVIHGETIVEPVAEGTNLAAIQAKADILAHPGLISEEEARLAADNGVLLEITTRRGHSLTNGHVAQMARRVGAGLIINNDAHIPSDFISRELRQKVAAGAGLTREEYLEAEANSRKLIERIIKQLTIR